MKDNVVQYMYMG